MSTLSKLQKSILAKLARRAFNRAGALARGSISQPSTLNSQPTLQSDLERLAADGSPNAFNEWRHANVAQACGKAGLRCCSQADYNLVKAHFLALLGEEDKALDAGVRAATEKRRTSEALLVKACREAGVHLAYADAISQSSGEKKPLDEASTSQIWHLIYTVRTRAKAKRDKAAKAVRNAECGVRSFETPALTSLPSFPSLNAPNPNPVCLPS